MAGASDLFELFGDEYTGHILLFSNRHTLVAQFITWGQRLIGKWNADPSFWPHHVAIVLTGKGDVFRRGILIDSSLCGVRITNVHGFRRKGHHMVLARLRNVTGKQAVTIVDVALEFLGFSYGLVDYVWFALDGILNKFRKRPRWYFSRKYGSVRQLTCSEFVAHVLYRAVKYKFYDRYGRWLRPSVVTPLDIWNAICMDKDSWQIVASCCVTPR